VVTSDRHRPSDSAASTDFPLSATACWMTAPTRAGAVCRRPVSFGMTRSPAARLGAARPAREGRDASCSGRGCKAQWSLFGSGFGTRLPSIERRGLPAAPSAAASLTVTQGQASSLLDRTSPSSAWPCPSHQANRARLRANHCSPRGEGGGGVRAGSVLLQGILRCGRCGRMMRVSYSGGRQDTCRFGQPRPVLALRVHHRRAVPGSGPPVPMRGRPPDRARRGRRDSRRAQAGCNPPNSSSNKPAKLTPRLIASSRRLPS
jgi:hypothetical protein